MTNPVPQSVPKVRPERDIFVLARSGADLYQLASSLYPDEKLTIEVMDEDGGQRTLWRYQEGSIYLWDRHTHAEAIRVLYLVGSDDTFGPSDRPLICSVTGKGNQ